MRSSAPPIGLHAPAPAGVRPGQPIHRPSDVSCTVHSPVARPPAEGVNSIPPAPSAARVMGRRLDRIRTRGIADSFPSVRDDGGGRVGLFDYKLYHPARGPPDRPTRADTGCGNGPTPLDCRASPNHCSLSSQHYVMAAVHVHAAGDVAPSYLGPRPDGLTVATSLESQVSSARCAAFVICAQTLRQAWRRQNTAGFEN